MRKEEGVRTGNSDEKRDINQNKARGTERIVSLSSGLNLEIRRLSLINNSLINIVTGRRINIPLINTGRNNFLIFHHSRREDTDFENTVTSQHSFSFGEYESQPQQTTCCLHAQSML